jgi:hypothetical protein
MRIRTTLLAASASTALFAAHAAKNIWHGKSGGFDITWSSTELSARDARGATAWSARTVAVVDFKDYEDQCEASEAWTALSVVGPILSARQEQNATCEGTPHPSAESSLIAVDVSRPQHQPSLADWFEEKDLYAALVADGIVKKTLEAGKLTAPATSAELLKLLSENSGDCLFRFEANSLTHFAFHHLEAGKVAVRVGLPYGCEAARGQLTQLGLLLPIPASLKEALEAADKRTQGFLAKDEKAVAKGASAGFSRHPKRAKE